MSGSTNGKKKKAKKWRSAEEELYSYAAKGKAELVAAMLGLPYASPEDSAPKDPQEPVMKKDPREINANWPNGAHKGMTPLMASAQQGRLPVVRLLLAFGAKLNATDSSGSTALMFACNRGRLDCVEALVQTGAQLDLRNDAGFTALAIAVGYDKAECVRALLAAGARPKQGIGRRCASQGAAHLPPPITTTTRSEARSSSRKPGCFSLTAEAVAHDFDREGPLNQLRLATAAPPAPLAAPTVTIVSGDAVRVGFSAPLRPGDCPLRGFELLLVPPLPRGAVATVAPGGPRLPAGAAEMAAKGTPALMIASESIELDYHWVGDADEDEEVGAAAADETDASYSTANPALPSSSAPAAGDGAAEGVGGCARVSVHVTHDVSEAATRATPAAVAASGGRIPTVHGALLLSGLDHAVRYTIRVRALCDGAPRPSSRSGTDGFSHEHGEAHWKQLRGVLSAPAHPVCTRALAVGRASLALRGGLLLGAAGEAGAAVALWVPPGGLHTWWQRRPGGGGAEATSATMSAAAGGSLRAARCLWNSAPIAVDASLCIYNAESVRLGVEAATMRPLPQGVAAVSAVVEVGLCGVAADAVAEAAIGSRSLIPSARFRRRVPSTLRLPHSAVVYGGPEPDGLVVLFSGKTGLAAMPDFQDQDSGGASKPPTPPSSDSWGPWRAVSSLYSGGGVVVDEGYNTDEAAYEDENGNADPVGSGLVGPCRFEPSGSHVSIRLSSPGRYVLVRLKDDEELEWAAATARADAEAGSALAKFDGIEAPPASPSKREEQRRRRRKQLARVLALPACMPLARTTEAREYVQCLAFADVAPSASAVAGEGNWLGRSARLTLVMCPSRDDSLCCVMRWAAVRGLRAVGALQLTPHGGLEAQARAHEYEEAAYAAALEADDDEEDDTVGDPALMGRLDAGLGGNCSHSALALAPGDAVQIHAFGPGGSRLPIQPATAAAAVGAMEEKAAWKQQLLWAWGSVEHYVDVIDVPLPSPRSPLSKEAAVAGTSARDAHGGATANDGILEREPGLAGIIGQWDKSIFVAEPQMCTPDSDSTVPEVLPDVRTLGDTAVALGGGITIRVRLGVRRRAHSDCPAPAWPMGDEDEAMWLTACVPTEALNLGPPKDSPPPVAMTATENPGVTGGSAAADVAHKNSPTVPQHSAAKPFDGGSKAVRAAFSEVSMLHHAIGQLESTSQRIAQESSLAAARAAVSLPAALPAEPGHAEEGAAAVQEGVPNEGTAGKPNPETATPAAEAEAVPAEELVPQVGEAGDASAAPTMADDEVHVPPTAGAALAAATTVAFAHNPTVGVVRVLAAAAGAAATAAALPAGPGGEGSAKRVECATLAHRLEVLSTTAAALASEPQLWSGELGLLARLANRVLEVLRGCTTEGAAGAGEEDEGDATVQRQRAACAVAVSGAIADAVDEGEADVNGATSASPEHAWQGWLMRFVSSGDEHSLWHSCAFAALDQELRSLTRRCAAAVRVNVKVGEKRFAHLATTAGPSHRLLAPIDGVTPLGTIPGIERHATTEAAAQAAAAAASGQEPDDREGDDPRIAQIMALDFNRNQALHALVAMQDEGDGVAASADDCIEWLVANPDADELALEPPSAPAPGGDDAGVLGAHNEDEDIDEENRSGGAATVDDGGYHGEATAAAATWLADSSLLSVVASAVSVGDGALPAEWWGFSPERKICLGLTATPFGDSDVLTHAHVRTLLAVMAELPLLERLAAETAAAVDCGGTAMVAEAAEAETEAAAGRRAAAAAAGTLAKLFGTTAARVAAELWQPRIAALMTQIGSAWHEWSRPWSATSRREHAQGRTSVAAPQQQQHKQGQEPRSLVSELFHRRREAGVASSRGNDRLGLELVLAKFTTAVGLRVEDESAAEARSQAEVAAIAAAEARARAAGKPVPPRPPPVGADGKEEDGRAALKLLRWLQARRAARLRVAKVAAEAAVQMRSVDERQDQRTRGVARQLQLTLRERKALRKARRVAESSAAWEEEEGRRLRNEQFRVARFAQRAAAAALAAAAEARILGEQAQASADAAKLRVQKMERIRHQEQARAMAAQMEPELAEGEDLLE